ncbi:CGNR zinc finger domain-containing protein [Pseudonocardia sp. GCM10023141]|uniref:CGNR zinc finger domain-containing protein n=1 Tax=Pseudonocardia sp. GCM10023141 TaxID=3252653 RepID=UPI0036238CBE
MDDFRFDCGATWLNLLATRGRSFSDHPEERLASAARLDEWLARSDLQPARAATDVDLEQARDVREALRALAFPTMLDEPAPPAAVTTLNALLAAHHDPVVLVAGEPLRREPPATVAAALARITRHALEQLTGPERHALVVCGEQDCRGIFLDPAGRRRWCPAPACASRGRVRALRARRKAEG